MISLRSAERARRHAITCCLYDEYAPKTKLNSSPFNWLLWSLRAAAQMWLKISRTRWATPTRSASWLDSTSLQSTSDFACTTNEYVQGVDPSQHRTQSPRLITTTLVPKS